MNAKKLGLSAAVAAVGLLALGTAGLAVADDGDAPGSPGWAMPMAHHGQMRGGPDGARTGTGEQHDEMQAAIAKALGITVADLNAQIDAGRTVPEIASDKGVDMTTVTAAMQAARPAGRGGPGMMGGTRGAEDCPYR